MNIEDAKMSQAEILVRIVDQIKVAFELLDDLDDDNRHEAVHMINMLVLELS